MTPFLILIPSARQRRRRSSAAAAREGMPRLLSLERGGARKRERGQVILGELMYLGIRHLVQIRTYFPETEGRRLLNTDTVLPECGRVHGDAMPGRFAGALGVKPVTADGSCLFKTRVAQVRGFSGFVARHHSADRLVKHADGSVLGPAPFDAKTDPVPDRKRIEVAQNGGAREGKKRTVLRANRARAGRCGKTDDSSGHNIRPCGPRCQRNSRRDRPPR